MFREMFRGVDLRAGNSETGNSSVWTLVHGFVYDFRPFPKEALLVLASKFTRYHVLFLPTLLVVFALALGDSALSQVAPSHGWTQLNPLTPFPARAAFASAYDPISKKVIVFGGTDEVNQFDDTWTFDGTTWTQISTSVTPGARADATMAFDVKTRKLVMFGGYRGFLFLNDTWLWDGATMTWTQAQPTTVPTGATNPSLFTDPMNGHVDLFGGYQGRFYSRSMYQWTGSDWLLLNPSTTPYPRAGAVATLDYARRNVVMFGGISDNWITQNTWTWDGKNWTEQQPANQPPPLYFTIGGYDPVAHVVVVFGGGSEGVDQSTTWTWDGSNWHQRFPPSSPPARELFGTVWYPPAGELLVFGGDLFSTNAVYGDTWSLR